MRAIGFAPAAVALVASLLPSMVEARDGSGSPSGSRWRAAYGSWHRPARMAPPVVTIVTPDLLAPVGPYYINRLDDGYDYPSGYGEYAVYGRWAFDRYGYADVVRCRLVWLDGSRWRSLNRCE